MEYKESLAAAAKEPAQAVRIIADNMIRTRPMSDVVYRPYFKNEIYYDLPVVGMRVVDIKKLYPEAKKGNIVYISTIFESCIDYEGRINFCGDAKIFYGGRWIFDSRDDPNEKNEYACDVHFIKGENPAIFMVRCNNDDEFRFEFMPSVRQYAMWAKYYLLHVRATSPIKEYRHEDGVAISKLYTTEMLFDGEFVFPEIRKYENKIDFENVFPEEGGTCAYSLTYAREDTIISIKTDCAHKVFVNGTECDDTARIKKGDIVLVKIVKNIGWSFEFEGDIEIPFLKSSGTCKDRWLILGTFGSGDCIDQKFAPEYKVQFTRPYLNFIGKKIFWRLAGRNRFIRPYLDTHFFGQWFYALMVGNFGLLKASQALDRAEYMDYFVNSTKLMADYFDYMRYERDEFGQTSFLELSAELVDLDSIGTMGRNMCELYSLMPDGNILHCIDVLGKAAEENIPRFEDGTYHRQDDMWADDTFMSCPFLVRLGMLKNNGYYYEEVIRQLKGFKKRLWMENEKLFSHIFFLNSGRSNNIPWGRGNGWVFITLSDVLEKLPHNIDGKSELLALYRTFAEGITAVQADDGLWHQVLNRKDSYKETSCSAMFMLGLCKGIINGWLPEKYKENILRAYNGIISKKIGKNGNVSDVCMGSSNSMNVEYYLNLGTIENDDHGTGIILEAISEMIKMQSIDKAALN